MAYNYIEQTFTRTIRYTNTGYYGGGNETAGLIKDFILSVFPDATLHSDNNPVNNLFNGTQTTTLRSIILKINGVNKISIDAGQHAPAYPFGFVNISFIYGSGSGIYTRSVGVDTSSNLIIQALSIPGVGYFIKDPSYTFKNAHGYFLSDENEYIIVYNGQLDPLNHNYSYNVLPSVGYNVLINNKIVLTELILQKINIVENPQTLRFKNKSIFKNSVANYFSNDRFYLGDDGHKYALIGTNDLLFRLE